MGPLRERFLRKVMAQTVRAWKKMIRRSHVGAAAGFKAILSQQRRSFDEWRGLVGLLVIGLARSKAQKQRSDRKDQTEAFYGWLGFLRDKRFGIEEEGDGRGGGKISGMVSELTQLRTKVADLEEREEQRLQAEKEAELKRKEAEDALGKKIGVNEEEMLESMLELKAELLERDDTLGLLENSMRAY